MHAWQKSDNGSWRRRSYHPGRHYGTVLYSLEWIPNNDKTFEELALRVGERLAFGNNGNYSDIVLWCVENGIESNRIEPNRTEHYRWFSSITRA
mmetsp:Transcript_21320/g.50454  ORF Transcript_21320/g.50454 Transcript_21320/m.50454 type:complete len:94 (-) Transcript_21320:384-665(-)